MTNKDFSLFPSPCYIMEEGLLRKNLVLIKSVADRAGVEIIQMCIRDRSSRLWQTSSSRRCHGPGGARCIHGAACPSVARIHSRWYRRYVPFAGQC